jgi:HAMP domain-containing protein
MKRLFLWLALALVLLIAFLFYRSRSANRLDVTPDAAREIEKAKRR